MTLAPGWLQTLADVNPSTHIVDGVRAVYRGELGSTDAWLGAVLTIALLAVGVFSRSSSARNPPDFLPMKGGLPGPPPGPSGHLPNIAPLLGEEMPGRGKHPGIGRAWLSKCEITSSRGPLGILTAGGDSPGLNAAIRAVGKAYSGHTGCTSSASTTDSWG